MKFSSQMVVFSGAHIQASLSRGLTLTWVLKSAY